MKQSKPEFHDLQQDAVRSLFPEWQKLTHRQENHYLLYQSPEWWDHLESTGRAGSQIFLGQMLNGHLAGAVPMQRREQRLRLIPFNMPASQVTLRYAEVLGGQPLMVGNEICVRDFYQSVFAKYPDIDAIYFKSIPEISEWYELLVHAASGNGSCFACVAREETFHYLTLPSSFDEFLQRFTKKKRYNLKRQVRLMEEAYQGRLRFECIVAPEQIDDFLAASEAVASQSWKGGRMTRALSRTDTNRSRYADLASRGLLRAYVLRDDQRPVAYALGYQYGGIYHYSDISYVESESRLSPGTVLLFLIVRDLIEHSLVRQVNFGITDADYKRQFSDQHIRDRTIWIFRSTLRNRLIRLWLEAARRVAEAARALRQRFGTDRRK